MQVANNNSMMEQKASRRMPPESQTTQVSFRLPRRLVQRMKNVSEANVWPPPPTQNGRANTPVIVKLSPVIEKVATGATLPSARCSSARSSEMP